MTLSTAYGTVIHCACWHHSFFSNLNYSSSELHVHQWVMANHLLYPCSNLGGPNRYHCCHVVRRSWIRDPSASLRVLSIWSFECSTHVCMGLLQMLMFPLKIIEVNWKYKASVVIILVWWITIYCHECCQNVKHDDKINMNVVNSGTYHTKPQKQCPSVHPSIRKHNDCIMTCHDDWSQRFWWSDL